MSDLAAVQDRSSGACRPTATRTRSARARSRTYGITYPPEEREGARRVRRPDGHGPPGQGDRHRRAVLDPAGHRPVRVRALEDDKKTQPAENIAPIVRNDYLAKVDAAAFQELLDAASAKMTTDELTKLGVRSRSTRRTSRPSRRPTGSPRTACKREPVPSSVLDPRPSAGGP